MGEALPKGYIEPIPNGADNPSVAYGEWIPNEEATSWCGCYLPQPHDQCEDKCNLDNPQNQRLQCPPTCAIPNGVLRWSCDFTDKVESDTQLLLKFDVDQTMPMVCNAPNITG